MRYVATCHPERVTPEEAKADFENAGADSAAWSVVAHALNMTAENSVNGAVTGAQAHYLLRVCRHGLGAKPISDRDAAPYLAEIASRDDRAYWEAAANALNRMRSATDGPSRSEMQGYAP